MKTVVVISKYASVPSKTLAFHQALRDTMGEDLVALAEIARPHVMSFSQWHKDGLLNNLIDRSPFKRRRSPSAFYGWERIPSLRFWSLNDPAFSRWLRRCKVETVLLFDVWETAKIDLLTSVNLVARVEQLSPNAKKDGTNSEVELRLVQLSPVPGEGTTLFHVSLDPDVAEDHALSGELIASYFSGRKRTLAQDQKGQSANTDTLTGSRPPLEPSGH